jgi:hypothetical protein
MVRTREYLHSAWDDCLVDVVNGAKGCVNSMKPPHVTHLAELLKVEMRSSTAESNKASGDLHHWPEQWATDSLHVARTRVFNIESAEGCIIRSEKAPHDHLHVRS